MAISFVGGKTHSFLGSSPSLTVSLTDLTGGTDTAPSANDIVCISYATSGAADTDLGVSTSGYTEVAELYVTDTYSTDLSVSYKVMGATPDTSVTLNTPPAVSTGCTVVVLVFRGVDATTPMDVTRTTSSLADTVLVDPPAITPVTSGAWVVVMGAGAHVDNVQTYSSSDLSGFLTVGINGARDGTGGAGYYTSWSSGSFDPAAWSYTGTNNTANSCAAVTMALRPTALTNYTLTGDAGSYTLTGVAASLLKGYAVQGATGSYAISGQTASFLRGYVLGSDPGSYAIGGQAANLLKGSRLAADAGSFGITGQTVNMYRVLSLTAETGSYSVSGQPASFVRSYRLAADAGSYAVNGQSATLKRSLLLSASPGSYTVTGQQASLNKGRTIAADPGSYTVSGQTAGFLRGYVLQGATGSYQVNGQAAALKRSLLLVGEPGSYAITGQDAQFIKTTVGNYTLLADPGSYVITGQSASLAYSGESSAASENILTRRRRRRSS